MYLAIDLPDTESRNKALKSFYDHDMLTLASGSRSVRIRAALSLSLDEAKEYIKRMENTFTDMFA